MKLATEKWGYENSFKVCVELFMQIHWCVKRKLFSTDSLVFRYIQEVLFKQYNGLEENINGQAEVICATYICLFFLIKIGYI